MKATVFCKSKIYLIDDKWKCFCPLVAERKLWDSFQYMRWFFWFIMWVSHNMGEFLGFLGWDRWRMPFTFSPVTPVKFLFHSKIPNHTSIKCKHITVQKDVTKNYCLKFFKNKHKKNVSKINISTTNQDNLLLRYY